MKLTVTSVSVPQLWTLDRAKRCFEFCFDEEILSFDDFKKTAKSEDVEVSQREWNYYQLLLNLSASEFYFRYKNFYNGDWREDFLTDMHDTFKDE